MDSLNELNSGPRAKEKDKTIVIPDREQYQKPDFAGKYADAKFFVIRSHSEDDVHKGIKYNVWASTPNGNKKLHAAYQEVQEKSGGCPVGLAEMVGPVDFNKNVEY
ncbi:YTH domain containing protein [Parasponia andersonii]|uniref:YTH domain-containing family protein n=1 Tax=Parasponia andersonii TaxID=3476 RepID=A0A2P5CT09_PARAD|nr:YTH domain containing protein [Parasponia andersonii]